MGPQFEYHWLQRNQEPLLWVPDAVAWSYARGRAERQRVNPLIAGDETV